MIGARERGLRATRRRTRILLAAVCASTLLADAVSPAGTDPSCPGGHGRVADPRAGPAPYWPELTPPQREALKPLADDWERLDFQTKKKWVEIANRYPKMSPEEQGHTRDRMREWALLTPDQRRVARDSFARIRAMPPEQRAAMLRKYQELPPERRQALATEGRAAKPLVVPKALPSSAPVPRRTQIREGANDHNPALAARKSASPIITPVAPKPVAPVPAPASPAANASPAATPATAVPGTGPVTPSAPVAPPSAPSAPAVTATP